MHPRIPLGTGSMAHWEQPLSNLLLAHLTDFIVSPGSEQCCYRTVGFDKNKTWLLSAVVF